MCLKASQGLIAVQQVQRVLKHLDLRQTLRYVQNPTLIPRALGDAQVTRLLTL